MADAPESLVLEYLRRLDTKLDRVIEDIADLKIRDDCGRREAGENGRGDCKSGIIDRGGQPPHRSS